MDNDNLKQVIEIRDSEIDADAVVRQIRENIRQRRSQAKAQGLDYEAFAEGSHASPDTSRFDRKLYYNLRWLSMGYYKIGVGLSLTESRIPLVAPLVQRVRAALHHLVIFYTNMLAGRQIRVNEYMVRTLTGLAEVLEKDTTSGEIEALRQEVADLRAQLRQLEAKMETGAET
ncbi:MAG: hypothetical protein GY832_10610 [Chloroflexi bacterium]|nr:hypothetical protein [Chloroflexota bacterium]